MNLFSRSRTRTARNPRPWHKDRARPQVEVLESRQMLTLTLSVGTNINTNNVTGDQSETTIAINPTNPLNLYAASNPNQRVSFDGGATWAAAGALPGGACCDKMAKFDVFGNLWVSYIGGTDELALSTNGGVSFVDVLTSGIGGDYPGVAVGPDGAGGWQVWAYGDNGATIAARGAKVTGLGAFGAFTASQSVTVGQFGDIAIGKDGRVTVTGTHCTGSADGPCPIKVATDFNGTAAGGFSAAVTVLSSNVGTFTAIPCMDNRTIHAHPNLAYNQMSGRLYITYTDRPSTTGATQDDTDIYVQSSADGGLTWNPRIKLNDDGATGKSQFYSDIDWDEVTGNLAATWYDARNSAANNSAQIYGTATEFRRGGWVANVQIATGLSNANTASSFEFGDYDTMDFYNGVFYRTWADNASPSTLTPSNTDAPGDQDMATAAVTVTDSPDPIPNPSGERPGAPLGNKPASTTHVPFRTTVNSVDRNSFAVNEASPARLDTPALKTRGTPPETQPVAADVLAEALSLTF